MTVAEVVFESKVRNQAIAQLVELMDREKLIKFVRERKIAVPGFSHRVKNAPYTLLKDSVKNFLRKPNNFEVLLTALFKHFEKSLSKHDMSENEKLLHLRHLDEIGDAEKLGIFMKIYPDRYSELVDQIDKALQKKMPVASIIFGNENSVQDQLNFIMKQKHLNSKDLLELISPYIEADIDTADNNLQEILQRHPIKDGQLLTYFLKHLSGTQEKDISENNAHILHAIILDCIKVIHNVIKHNKQLSKDREVREKKYIEQKKIAKKLKTENDQMNSLLQQKRREMMSEKKKQLKEKHMLQKEIIVLKEQLEANSEEISMLKKQLISEKTALENIKNELNALNNENKKLKLIVKGLNSEGETLFDRSDIYESQFKENIDMNLIGDQAPILLFTREKDGLYEAYFSEKQLHYFNDIDELEKRLEGNDLYEVVFVNTGTLTTRQKFEIEKICNAMEQEFRMISGTPKQILRKIITYMDGGFNEIVF